MCYSHHGFLLGLVLVHWKASLILAANTPSVSVLAVLVTVFLLGELGIRMRSGNAAMPKVTAAATMAAALAGGGTLGVIVSHYARKKAFQRSEEEHDRTAFNNHEYFEAGDDP